MLIISFTPSSPGPRLISADPAGFLKGGELQDDVLQEGVPDVNYPDASATIGSVHGHGLGSAPPSPHGGTERTYV